jgi:beta-phosphoglucomutase-like phosphatase (HAD superfamily)
MKPEDCLVIEDAQAGVEAPITAGMVCIAVPHPFIAHQDFISADYVLHSIDDIIRFFEFAESRRKKE